MRTFLSGKELLKRVMPAILWETCDAFIVSYRSRGLPYAIKRTLKDRGALFDGDAALFIELARNARIYVEYGAGESTAYMLTMGSCKRIVSVETSPEWAEKVTRLAKDPDISLTVVHIDMGDIGAWGRPLSTPSPEVVLRYVEAPFRALRGEEIDLVLVDGRYRVAAFLTAMVMLPAGTPVLFDDYRDRKGYHVVEKFYTPARSCGRQALFIAPGPEENLAAIAMRDAFLCEME